MINKKAGKRQTTAFSITLSFFERLQLILLPRQNKADGRPILMKNSVQVELFTLQQYSHKSKEKYIRHMQYVRFQGLNIKKR